MNVLGKRGRKKKEVEIPSNLAIPTSILRDRTLSVLEGIVEYLREHHDLNYHQIAKLLNRDDRTIWTVYRRAKQKRK